MSSTNTEWIDDLLHLNERIIAVESSLSDQSSLIMFALEENRTFDLEERIFLTYKTRLQMLRVKRDTMLIGSFAED